MLLPYAIAGALLLTLQRLSPTTLIRVGLVLVGITLLWSYELGTTGRVHVGITVSAALALVGAVALSRKSWTLALCAWTAVVVAAGWGLTTVFATSDMAAGVAHEYVAATGELLGRFDLRWPEFLHALSALPLAAGIAGAVFALHRSGALRWLWVRIEAAGRLALTNYIGQSLVLSALAERWGLHLYGRLDGPQLTALAIGVFAMLALLSQLWLRRYRMGPLEWLWRCGTYGAWLPNRLVSRDGRAAAPAGITAPSEKREVRRG